MTPAIGRVLTLLTLLAVGLAPAAAAEPQPPPAPAEAPSGATADTPQARFAEANRLYLRGEYAAAAAAYASLHTSEQIEDPALYHNLGNAYFRTGAYGSAILYYRRALRLEPAPEVVEALERNLDAARRTLRARYRGSAKEQVIYGEAGGLFYKVTHLLDRTALPLVFAGFFVLLMGLLVARRLRPGAALLLGRVAVPIAVPIAVATALLAVAVWGQRYTDASQRVGVIVSGDARLRDGKDTQARGDTIHEGLEVRILREDAPWTMVEKTDGQRGWVQSSDVKQI